MWASLAPLANQQICNLQSERICRIRKICRIGIIEEFQELSICSSNFAVTNQKNWELVSGRCAFNIIDFHWSWTQFWRHFGVLGHHLGTIWEIIGCKGAPRRLLRVPRWIFIDFWWILGVKLGALFGYFLILCMIWGAQKPVWIAGTHFKDFGLENLLIFRVPTSQQCSK